MSVLFYGLVLILIAFSIHLIIWKIRIPKNHTIALLKIFFGTYIIGIYVFIKFPNYIKPFGIYAPETMWEFLQLSFLFIFLAAAYIATYPVIEANSPSLVIIAEIAKLRKSSGLNQKILENTMNNDVLIMPRLKDLIMGNMIFLDDDRYKLTQNGMLIARLFIIYRKLLKKEEKGG